MNLKEKLPIAQRAIQSIARHDDEDSDVRKVFLASLQEFIKDEIAAIDARVAERVAQLS